VWKPGVEWTPRVEVAKEKGTLEEASGTSGYRAGAKQLRTLKGRLSSGEDELGLLNGTGGRRRRKTTGPLEMASPRWD
jgi:hypothetical protein